MVRANTGRGQRRPARAGFTLIELLVVVAIIAILMAILLPTLSRARAHSKVSVCMSNLRQVGLAIQTYAADSNGAIPRGPELPLPFAAVQRWDQWASNQLWIGHLRMPNGFGALLARDLREPRTAFCPADDTNDPIEELDKLKRGDSEDVYGSYLYRQRDQATRDRLETLGLNDAGFPARALALDANSLGPDERHRTNHTARMVNLLYLEGHVLTRENRQDVFALREPDYRAFPSSVERRLNEILVAADYAERDDPLKAPPLPAPPEP